MRKWMQIQTTRKGFLLIILLGVLSALAGCGGSVDMAGGGTETGNPVAVASFADAAGMEAYLKDQYASNILPEAAYAGIDQRPAEDDQSNLIGDETAGNAFKGVDSEYPAVTSPGKIASDGAHLFIPGDRRVNIASAAPPEAMAALSVIHAPGEVEALCLYNNILVVFYTPDGGEGAVRPGADVYAGAQAGVPYEIPAGAMTGVMLADVSDPAGPRILKTIEMDGRAAAAGVIRGRLFLVMQFLPDLTGLDLSYDGTAAGLTDTAAANAAALDAYELADLIPYYDAWGADDALVASGPLLQPENTYYPETSSGGSIVALVSFDLDDPGLTMNATGAAMDVHSLRLTDAALYLAASHLEASEEGTAGGWTYAATIYKLDIAGDAPVFSGTGTVEGKVVSSDAMDVHEDILSIATSTPDAAAGWAMETYHLFCLSVDGDEFPALGRLDDILCGHGVRAIEYDGPLVYVSTFGATDPVYVFDLTDPFQPRQAGELNISGQRHYIRRLEDGRLLALARSNVADASDGSLNLYLFDMDDPYNPMFTALVGDEDADSEALNDADAFFLDKDAGVAVFPIMRYAEDALSDVSGVSRKISFTGVAVYHVSSEYGFEYAGEVSTFPDSAGPEAPEWQRGIILDDVCYGVSPAAVRVAAIDDLYDLLGTLLLD